MEKSRINRRAFLGRIGAAGLGSVLAAAQTKAEPNEPNTPAKAKQDEFPQVPKRRLGKTGVEVPVLALGANRLDNQIILRNAVRWGVTYWDTAHSYVGGNSEITIGKFIAKNPQARKKLFIVSKASGANRAAGAKAIVDAIEQRLAESLKRMNTSYIDLYYGVHGLSEPAQLTEQLREWVKSAKERKLIRFFGFSIHKNIARCLAAAAGLDWIDAIMTSYNFRLMQDAEIQAAVQSCHKAGIGLVAMKTVALTFRQRRRLEAGEQIDTQEDKKLTEHFLKRGFTPAQAKIKTVLKDKRFSSACVGMHNAAVLTENASAVLDKTKLTQDDRDILGRYAIATCSGYCAGCANICDSALPDTPYVSDIMRYLMYYNSYGDKQGARGLFARIPASVRNRLLSIDYRTAEAACPQHIPIGEAIAEAVRKLA